MINSGNGHDIAFIEIERKSNTADPLTEHFDLGLEKQTVGRRTNFEVNFDIVGKEKKCCEGGIFTDRVSEQDA